MIRGFIRDQQPFVRAFVSIPRVVASVPIELLVDTGSHLTVLPRSLFEALGVDPAAQLPAPRRVRGVGVGGSQDYQRVRVVIAFSAAEPPLRPYPIWVAVPVGPDAPVGPILGMDAMVDFRLSISVREAYVGLEPVF